MGENAESALPGQLGSSRESRKHMLAAKAGACNSARPPGADPDFSSLSAILATFGLPNLEDAPTGQMIFHDQDHNLPPDVRKVIRNELLFRLQELQTWLEGEAQPMATERTRDTPAWTGWHRSNRPGSAWRAVCQGEPWDSCWDLLSAHVESSGDSVVLETGRHPEDLRRKGA
jgi:hypothetical protein